MEANSFLLFALLGGGMALAKVKYLLFAFIITGILLTLGRTSLDVKDRLTETQSFLRYITAGASYLAVKELIRKE